MIIGQWKNIPGFDGKYQVNTEGEIRRVFTNSCKPMKQFAKNGKPGMWFVKLTKDKKAKDYVFSRIMWKTFYGEIPEGMCVYHKNGIRSENGLWNLELVSKKDLGHRTGSISKARSVVMLDKDGNIIRYYRSASACADDNYYTRQAIEERCSADYKKPAQNGCDYAWEDSLKSIRRAKKRLREAYG